MEAGQLGQGFTRCLRARCFARVRIQHPRSELIPENCSSKLNFRCSSSMEVTVQLKSDRDRVHVAILTYLLVFFAMSLSVWIWFVTHRHGPHHFPLGEPIERFGDLLHFSGKYQVGKDPRMLDPGHLSGTLFPANYPPFAVILYLFLLQVCAPYALPVMLVAFLGSVTIACTLVWRRVRKLESYRWYVGVAVFATGLFGWGTEEVVMRGNIEGIMWIGVCLGAALYARRKYQSAAVAFGVAACIKPHPALWLAFMVRHRRYREAAVGVVTAVAVTLGSLLMIDRNPVRAYRHISAKSHFFYDYVLAFRNMDEMKLDHSLMESMKTISRVIRNHGFHFGRAEDLGYYNNHLAWKLYAGCLLISAIISLVSLWQVWNKPVLNQIFAIGCVTTVLPMVTGDYTLTILLIPMGFFLIFLVEDVAEGKVSMSLGGMLWFLLPAAWIMAAEPYVILHGVLKCFAILLLLGAGIFIPLPSTIFGELDKVEKGKLSVTTSIGT